MRSRAFLFSALVGVSAVSLIVATVAVPTATSQPEKAEASSSNVNEETLLTPTNNINNGSLQDQLTSTKVVTATPASQQDATTTTDAAGDGGGATTTAATAGGDEEQPNEEKTEEGGDDAADDGDGDGDSGDGDGQEDEIMDEEAEEDEGRGPASLPQASSFLFNRNGSEPSVIARLGDVPVSAQIDGDVDEETIATVLHFLKEMDESDDVAAAATEGSGDQHHTVRKDDLGTQDSPTPINDKMSNGPASRDEFNSPGGDQEASDNQDEDDEDDDGDDDDAEEEDDFDSGRDDPYAWENEVPNPDRTPGGPGYYSHHYNNQHHNDNNNNNNNGGDGQYSYPPRPRPSPETEQELPTRFDMLRAEVLAHGARAPSRLLNDFPHSVERVGQEQLGQSTPEQLPSNQ